MSMTHGAQSARIMKQLKDLGTPLASPMGDATTQQKESKGKGRGVGKRADKSDGMASIATFSGYRP
eukprot:4671579-Amphidinium_carterae.1